MILNARAIEIAKLIGEIKTIEHHYKVCSKVWDRTAKVSGVEVSNEVKFNGLRTYLDERYKKIIKLSFEAKPEEREAIKEILARYDFI